MGRLVKAKAKEQGFTHNDLGRLINRHRQTVANIYKRSSIDSNLLKSICEALKYDFFAVFYEDGILQAVRYNEVNQLKLEITRLNNDLEDRNQMINRFDIAMKTYQKAIETNEQALSLVEEHVGLRPRKKAKKKKGT